MSDLKQLHTDVWTFRGAVYPYWPTPPPLDALRYAVTECGEAMDAYLRQHRQGDSRNSERPGSDEALLDELADCAMMLLTAVNLNVIPKEIQVENYYLHALVPVRHRIEVLCHDVSAAVLAARSDDDETSRIYFSWIREAIYAARWVETYPGMDLAARLHGRLIRIFERHVATKVTPAEARRLRRAAIPWEEAL